MAARVAINPAMMRRMSLPHMLAPSLRAQRSNPE
jgi:hypothetical protein